MRKIHIIPCAIALSLFPGCMEKIDETPNLSDNPIAVMATNTTEITKTVTTDPSIIHEAPEGAILNVNSPVEVYEEITVQELLYDTNVQLENGNAVIGTSEIGDFDVTVSYTFAGKHYEHPVSYTVVDTTAPTLLNAGSGIVIESGEHFDLNAYVGFADNYDRTPTLTYVGEVDTSVCGEYPLTATITDASGNETSWALSVTVVDELPTPEDNNTRITFESFTQQYASDRVRFGIDVSKWQGEIDFEAVKNAGCSFVIMRIGHYYDENVMDAYYLQNMEAAKAAGLEVGVYFYTTANTEDEIKENVQWIVQQLDGQELDFPVAFDWEEFSNFQQYEMNIHDLNALYTLFAEEMEQNGYSAMLYSSKNFLNNFWYDHSDRPVWLAHYTDETDYTGDYAMWQMSCYGRIDGIEGDVDFNILYPDMLTN